MDKTGKARKSGSLIGFYRGTASDTSGRYIQDIWAWDFENLERTHDYIQWLFPTTTPSKYNANAPLLDAGIIEEFRNEADLKDRLLRSLRLMLPFYGLTLTGDEQEPTISKADNYGERKSNWQDAPQGYLNHNLLRLTRIIECLTALGLGSTGRALLNCLAEIQAEEPARIPAKTLGFWQQAAGVEV